MENKEPNYRIWIRVAQVAGAFAIIISVLLIVNYVQYKSMDPVETELITTLVDRLNKNPNDTELREQIRALDLLSRKAYFTNQWQIRTGGYLLLLSIAILVIAIQMVKSGDDKMVDINTEYSSFRDQMKARKWVSVGGSVLVISAMILAFITHRDFEEFPEMETITAIEESEPQELPSVRNHDTIIIADNSNQTNEVDSSVQISSENVIDQNESNDENNVKQDEVPLTRAHTDENKASVSTEDNKDLYPSDKEIKNNHSSFRGPGGNGISYHKNIPTSWDGNTGENVLWKTKIPIHGYNSPIVWENKVFVSGASPYKREIYCLDINNGNILWTVNVTGVEGSPDKSPPTTDDTGLAAPSLTTDGIRVYGIFGNGDLIAVDMNGKTIWSQNMGATDNHYGHSSSLYMYQDILILQYDTKTKPRLIGLKAESGETLWSTERDVRISWASPIVVNTGNRTEVILAADPIVASYDPLTGEENWSIDCIFGEVGPSPAYYDGVVYAMNEYAILVAIQIGDQPTILWETDEYLSDVPSPVAYDGLFFMATSYGAFACYDAKTGEKFWEQEFDNGFYSSPMLVDGKLYMMDMMGIMHIFKADSTFEKIGESSIGEKSMTTPAFSENRIYIRGNNHLFCIGK